MNEDLLPWEQAGWLESAKTWIKAEIGRQGLELIAEIDQVHVRPWSTVLRVITSGEICFFKASAPYFGHETALTGYLARHFPQLSPHIIALDAKRHWLLMRDAGQPLRNLIKESQSVEPWREVLPLFVSLQKSMMNRQADLLKLGVPDRRLIALPVLFKKLLEDKAAMLIDQPEGLTMDEYQRLEAISLRFESMCAQLANCGIPESLHHDDFHDGNVFVSDGRTVFTDWGECAVAHPFFSLVVMLRGVENSLEVQADAAQVQELRDMYLSLWDEYGSLAELRQMAALAERVGLANRALTWHLVIAQLPKNLTAEYAMAVPAYLKDFINGIGDQ